MFEKNDAVVRWNRRDVVMYFFLFCAGFDLKEMDKTKKPLHVILFLFWYVKWYFSEML